MSSGKIKGALVLVSAVCALCACDHKASTSAREDSAGIAANQPIRIENFSLGTRLGPHGGIATGAGEHMFEAGQLIYLAMELKHAPVGTPVRVVWKAQGNIVLGEETKQVRRGQRFLNFAADSASLPVAPQYSVEVSVNGQTLAELEFDLILASA